MLSNPNILVCTDFSESSDLALKAAEAIRLKTNGRLTIIYACDQLVGWDWLPQEGLFHYRPELEKKMIDSLSASMDNQMTLCQVKGEPKILFGVPVSVVSQEIIDQKIDFVILGHRGQSKSPLNFGSFAQKIIANATVPALIIKERFELEKVAALLDPTYPMEKIISWSEEYASVFSSKLSLLSIATSQRNNFLKENGPLDEEETRLLSTTRESIKKNLLGRVDPEIKVELSDERSIAFQLNELATEDNIHLVIMKKHHPGFLDKLLLGSETRRMIEIFKGNLFILPS